jgi:ubiquinone biosynthesis accessory factor UbiJ
MLHTLHQMLAPAVMDRVTLLLNHVLASEPVATARLLPHAGKVVQIEAQGWPSLLPPLPPLAWRITPAGLLEWCGAEASPASELHLRVKADNPALLAARVASGEMPAVDVAGDAALAGDVNWLMQNLRWDLAADLERVLPPSVAATLVRAGSGLARALQAAVQGLGALRDRWPSRPGA